MGSIKSHSEPWKQFATNWASQTSPSRPSKGEIVIYKKLIQEVLEKKVNPKVLILGATPEFRDILTNYSNAQVVLADINIEMIMAMADLVKKVNKDEIWIRSDWLRLPVAENYFDLILGDFTYENMQFKFHDEYFRNIKCWLKKEGSYVGRTMIYRKYHQTIKLEKLEEICKDNKIDNKLITLFWDTAVFFTGKTNKHEVRVIDFINKLKIYKNRNKEAYKNSVMKKILDRNEKFFPINKSWFVWDEQGFKKMIVKYFVIKSEGCDLKINMPDEYSDMAPIIKLAIKK